MKNLIPLLLLCCGLSFTQNASAQVDATINPIGLLFGDFSLGADFGVNESFSVETALGFGSNDISDVDGTNISVNIVPKYYLNPNRGADRFYVDVFLRFVNRNWNYEDNSGFTDVTSTRFGLGFGLGYKVVSARGFVFDIGFGAGRAFVDNNKYEDSTGVREDLDWPLLMIQGKLGVGYRFGGKK
jgi:hypothetical protein